MLRPTIARPGCPAYGISVREDAQKARVRDMRLEEWDTYDKGILAISNLTL
jgi:hypothetical protein